MRVEEELRTPAGRVVKIRLDRMTAVVFGQDNRPEVVRLRGRETMEQPVPGILFVGEDFGVAVQPESFHLVENRGNRLRIPYKSHTGQIHHVGIANPSAADAFPVYVRHCRNVRDFIGMDDGRVTFGYMVVSSELPRMDTVALRVRHPDAQILVVKAPAPSAGEQGRVDGSKVRASDLAHTERGKSLTGNPVFRARIHLRLLELDLVRDLIGASEISPDEVDFICTFLDLMIRNDQNRTELTAAKPELEELAHLFRAAALVLRRDRTGLEAALGTLTGDGAKRLAIQAGARSLAQSGDKVAELQYWAMQILLDQTVARLEGPRPKTA